MFKVLIVDDEPFVRQGLSLIIDWEKYGFTICGEAQNGLKALEFIEKDPPDVIISDVRMPDLDGLEFIKKITEGSHSNIKFIFLSGYDDFKYAQHAIKYGARQYLLKPIEEDELIDSLTSIKEELVKEVSYNKQMMHYNKIMASESIKAIVNGNSDEDDFVKIMEFYNIKGDEQIRYVSINFVKDNDINEIKRDNKVIIEKALGENLKDKVFQEDINTLSLIVNKKMLTKFNNFKDYINSFYYGIMKEFGGKILMMVGKEVRNINYIKDSYDSLYTINNYKFFAAKSGVLFYEDIENIQYKNSLGRALFTKELIDAIEVNNEVDIRAILLSIFENTRSSFLKVDTLKINIDSFVFEIFKIITDVGGNVEEILETIDVLELNLNKINSSELEEKIMNFSLSCARYLNKLKKRQSTSIIYQVEDYIKKNYNKDINLKIISQKFYINHVYLGQIFRQYHKMGFTDYLRNLRIEESKRLLRRTNMKIYEISEIVGYKDHNYFFNKFESLEKITPAQYRKAYEGKDIEL